MQLTKTRQRDSCRRYSSAALTPRPLGRSCSSYEAISDQRLSRSTSGGEGGSGNAQDTPPSALGAPVRVGSQWFEHERHLHRDKERGEQPGLEGEREDVR